MPSPEVIKPDSILFFIRNRAAISVPIAFWLAVCIALPQKSQGAVRSLTPSGATTHQDGTSNQTGGLHSPADSRQDLAQGNSKKPSESELLLTAFMQDEDPVQEPETHRTASKPAEPKSAEPKSAEPKSAEPRKYSPTTTEANVVSPSIISQINEPDIVPLTIEMVNARRASIDDKELDEEQKSKVAKYFGRAIELLNQASEAESRQLVWKAERENAPGLIEEIKKQMDQPMVAELEFSPVTKSSELDRLRAADEELLAEARRNLEKWEARAKQRTERRPQMPALIESTRKQLEQAEAGLKIPQPEGEKPALAIASRTEQEAFVALLKIQLELYRTEQQRYDSLNELFPLQRDLLTKSSNILAKRVELWKEAIEKARLVESERQRQEARTKLKSTHPALRSLAERSSSLTQKRRDQQKQISQANIDLAKIRDAYQNLDRKFKTVAEKEKRVGLTTAIGILLRNQRSNLPNIRSFEKVESTGEAETLKLQSEQMLLEDEREGLVDIEVTIDEIVSAIPMEDLPEEEFRRMTRDLLTDQRKYLDDLLKDLDQNLFIQSEIVSTCSNLKNRLSEFEAYLDERVLWVASGSVVDRRFPSETLDSAKTLIKDPQWGDVGKLWINDIRANLLLYSFVLIGISILVFLRVPARRAIAHLRESVQSDLYSGVLQAITAVLITIAITSAWPALIGFAGWRLSNFEQGLAVALGETFKLGALHFWVLNAVRGMCERNGVAERFLKWPNVVIGRMHFCLLIYLLLGVPLSAIVTFSGLFEGSELTNTLGRMALVSFNVLLAILIQKLGRPRGVVVSFLRSNADSLLYSARWIWYPLAVATPLILALLALLGYQYTSEQLTIRFELTLGLVFLLVIAMSIVTRWLFAARETLAIKQAEDKRNADLIASQKPVSSDPVVPFETQQVNLAVVNRQVIQVMRALAGVIFLCGCWAIWSQVLPALQVVSRVELWSITIETSELVQTASDGSMLRDVSRVKAITLGHLFLAIAVMGIAVLASRNLPGVMELSFFQQLPLEQGGRTAISKLTGYAIIVTAVIVTSNVIGMRWGNIQWLVAALTVGLGFGLQEIFANFVSGLIILFERPVRVGDVVTIDNVTGTVSNIQIRATTITDWDLKEFIVPNKEFVTGRLMNWTLSDRRHRIIINASVAYNSDVDRALKLLEEIALSHPMVLTDPPPVVTFEGFNESSLGLSLRAHLINIDHRFIVRTELNLQLAKRFKSEGIEFAYPQLDLNLRSVHSQAASVVNSLTSRMKPHQFGSASEENQLNADTLDSPSLDGERRVA